MLINNKKRRLPLKIQFRSVVRTVDHNTVYMEYTK